MPPEILDMIFDFFVTSLGKNIIHIHPDMQTATIAIAGSTIVARQPNDVMIMTHNNLRSTQITTHGVVPLLSLLLNRHLHDLVHHSAITLGPSQMTSLCGNLVWLTMSAIKRVSVIRLFPRCHQLTAVPTRDCSAKLVSVIMKIPLNYVAPSTLVLAHDYLEWIQQNMHLLQAHSAILQQLQLHVKYKDVEADATIRLQSGTGTTSINQALTATMRSMLGLRGKQKLVGEYTFASSATMANECAELEDIVRAADRNRVETFIDVQRRIVEVTVKGGQS